jgi:hypothetical protein
MRLMLSNDSRMLMPIYEVMLDLQPFVMDIFVISHIAIGDPQR